MTSKTSSPNAVTSFLAKWGPMPLIMPLPRYFSMPSRELGGRTFRKVVLNCRPCSRWLSHRPLAWMNSPGWIDAADPRTVTSSRWPRTLTRRTQKPVSGLWNVTRSTRPDRGSRLVGARWVLMRFTPRIYPDSGSPRTGNLGLPRSRGRVSAFGHIVFCIPRRSPVVAVGNVRSTFSKGLVDALVASTGPAASRGAPRSVRSRRCCSKRRGDS